MQLSGNCYKIRLAAHQIGYPLTLHEYPILGGDTRHIGIAKIGDGGLNRRLIDQIGRRRELGQPEQDAYAAHLQVGAVALGLP